MLTLSRGRYRARPARTREDLEAALALRWRAFRAGASGQAESDADAFDAVCSHVLVEEVESGVPVSCFRLMHLASGGDVGRSYSAQFYDLSRLSGLSGPMVELGRFCAHPDWRDADILRVAWAALSAEVDARGVRMLFGCASFPGTEAEAHREAFAHLAARHLAPESWRPRVKAPSVVRFAALGPGQGDARRAMARMPPLLRSYLLMGGRVSDHAVVDRDLGTLHVFTGLEVDAVPPARARSLRGVGMREDGR